MEVLDLCVILSHKAPPTSNQLQKHKNKNTEIFHTKWSLLFLPLDIDSVFMWSLIN